MLFPPGSDTFWLHLFGDHYNANMEMKQLSWLIELKKLANEFHASSLIDMVALKYEDVFLKSNTH